jgi:hypothetical protein
MKIARIGGVSALVALFASSAVGYAQELDDGAAFSGFESSALETDLHEVYWVTYWHSDTPPTNRSASVVTTGNTSDSKNCEITVDWFAQGGQPEGSTTTTVPPRQARDHCSRAVPDSVTVCNAERVPAGLIEGYAIIKTSRDCRSNIAADARVYHTTGEQDDILAAQNVKIVKLPRGNQGD